jgi:hypothetical protein
MAADLVLELPPGQQRNSVHQVVHNLASEIERLPWSGRRNSEVLEARRAATAEYYATVGER